MGRGGGPSHPVEDVSSSSSSSSSAASVASAVGAFGGGVTRVDAERVLLAPGAASTSLPRKLSESPMPERLESSRGAEWERGGWK